jgi:ribonuclease VapC
MSGYVVDTSAIIAFVNRETGWEAIGKHSDALYLSAVNLAECVAVIVRKGATLDGARRLMSAADFRIVDFDRDLAEQAGALIAQTKQAGLSLGDRACLALAVREKLPVLTADKAWKDLKVGVDIRLVR